ncbi:hypothetical protein [Streptomyces sp. NPDC002671]
MSAIPAVLSHAQTAGATVAIASRTQRPRWPPGRGLPGANGQL